VAVAVAALLTLEVLAALAAAVLAAVVLAAEELEPQTQAAAAAAVGTMALPLEAQAVPALLSSATPILMQT
jgi:hypothetical protein